MCENYYDAGIKLYIYKKSRPVIVETLQDRNSSTKTENTAKKKLRFWSVT